MPCLITAGHISFQGPIDLQKKLLPYSFHGILKLLVLLSSPKKRPERFFRSSSFRLLSSSAAESRVTWISWILCLACSITSPEGRHKTWFRNIQNVLTYLHRHGLSLQLPMLATFQSKPTCWSTCWISHPRCQQRLLCQWQLAECRLEQRLHPQARLHIVTLHTQAPLFGKHTHTRPHFALWTSRHAEQVVYMFLYVPSKASPTPIGPLSSMLPPILWVQPLFSACVPLRPPLCVFWPLPAISCSLLGIVS